MATALVSSADLALYLNDPSIDTARADFLIRQAQTLCESIVSQLSDGAEVVVTRVAGRAYTDTVTTRAAQIAAAGSPFGMSSTGGVYLNRQDKADLRRLAGGSSAFTINLLPPDYTLPANLPPWDANSGIVVVVETS